MKRIKLYDYQQEMVESIIRVAQGIYCYPKIDTKWGSGIIPPSIEDIANGIAKRDKVRIVPTGAYVLNLLGLSNFQKDILLAPAWVRKKLQTQ